jgi:hypothetical protein
VVPDPDDVVLDPGPLPDDPADEDVDDEEEVGRRANEFDPQAERPVDTSAAAATVPRTAPGLNRGHHANDFVTRATLCPWCAETGAPGLRSSRVHVADVCRYPGRA